MRTLFILALASVGVFGIVIGALMIVTLGFAPVELSDIAFCGMMVVMEGVVIIGMSGALQRAYRRNLRDAGKENYYGRN